MLNVFYGSFRPIVNLIKGHNLTVQVKAAEALEALADFNAGSQKAFLDLDAPKALMRVLKVWLNLLPISCLYPFHMLLCFLHRCSPWR